VRWSRKWAVAVPTRGYDVTVVALEFHHRDPATKDFAIGGFSGSLKRLVSEALKCDLICANCHRIRHALEDAKLEGSPQVEHRRNTKTRAVGMFGATCYGCAAEFASPIFEFHHRSAETKEFGVASEGLNRRWQKVVAELAKCVMLCANCHREVHAGVRELDEGLLGLAEDALAYVA
jgi:predicted HNH restriction endonuclease